MDCHGDGNTLYSMATNLPWCYLNGAYLPLEEARISPLDRGFLFGDSVYEVLPVYGGRMFRLRQHFDRLARSLNEIGMTPPHTHEQWLAILEELVRRNRGGDQSLYVQVTSGAEQGRRHAPAAAMPPTIFAMAEQLPQLTAEIREHGLSAITLEDFRWGRCDIKTTALVANVMMRRRAVEAGAHEAIIVRDGHALEGAASSLFVVLEGVLTTPPNGTSILPGTTREVVLELAKELLPTAIQPITLAALRAAEEVWISAASRGIAPVCRIDGRAVGDGVPGRHWRAVDQRFAKLRCDLESRSTHD